MPSKRSFASARPSRSNDDCGRTASTCSRAADLEHRVGEAGIGAGRNEVEGVAEVPADRAARDMSVPTSRTGRSPFSRSARRSAAVPGAPQAETRTVSVLHDRSILSAASCSSRTLALGLEHRAASSRASSRPGRPRSPGASAAAATRTRRRRAPRAGSPAASAGSSRSGSRRPTARLITLTSPSTGSRMYSGSGLCQASTGSKRVVEVDVRPDGVQADAVPELAQPLDRRRARRRVEVVEHAPGHQEVGRRRACLRLELRQLAAPPRARGRRRGAAGGPRPPARGRRTRSGSRRRAPPRAARGSAPRSNAQLTSHSVTSRLYDAHSVST